MNPTTGFGDTLGALVPLGVAGAFSWLPVAGVVVLLLERSGPARVWAFVAGRFAGLAVVTAAFVAGARALPPAPSLEGPVVAGVELGAGLALVALGGLTWRGRRHAHHHTGPAWLRRLGEASARAVFATSVLVDLQPKGLVLALAAGVVVRAGSLPPVEAGVAVLVYLVLAASSVLLPVVAAYLAPGGTQRWLRAIRTWLSTHGSVVTAVVLALVGLFLLVDGLRRF